MSLKSQSKSWLQSESQWFVHEHSIFCLWHSQLCSLEERILAFKRIYTGKIFKIAEIKALNILEHYFGYNAYIETMISAFELKIWSLFLFSSLMDKFSDSFKILNFWSYLVGPSLFLLVE